VLAIGPVHIAHALQPLWRKGHYSVHRSDLKEA